MTKKELAQKRNWFKFQLTGLYRIVDPAILTEEEHLLYKEWLTLREVLLSNFDRNSEAMGLEVPTKCWCRKPARYPYQGNNPQLMQALVCKEHRF